MTLCRTCGDLLTEQNTYKNYNKSYDYECKTCKNKRNKKNRKLRGKDWLEYRKEYSKRRVKENRCYNLRNNYGITLQEWEELFISQGSKCGICGTKEMPSMGWHTDHCHKTSKVRGILCHSCNTGLGKFQDSTELLKKAVMYLDKSLSDLV